ncbi:phosphoribosyltransferase [Desulfovibrio sp. X2]|uniref:phosphoribosyltransferase n=1 Tax=Desulfovibrio sp. X2 TaxID=941449 RepID=UPI000358BF94|nr:phosphoribosyltransferase [Desulfovibrio sp. X2]EPR40772.1 phosphoribosyltransferase [Desulfovibrio sp. X2]
MTIYPTSESGEKTLLQVPGLPYGVELPLVKLPGTRNGRRLRIASLNLVGQIRLNHDLGHLLAERIRAEIGDLDGVAVLTVVEKALQLTQVAAGELGLDAVAVAYNRVKPHMEADSRPLVQVGSESVTSGGKLLALYERDIHILAQATRGIILIDDVVSSGGTILGLLDLVEAAVNSVGRPAPELLGIFCAAQEGKPRVRLPAPVHALASLPTPEELG